MTSALASHTWQLSLCLLQSSWTHFSSPVPHICEFDDLGLQLGWWRTMLGMYLAWTPLS